MEQGSPTRQLARQLARADDVDAFFAANRHRLAPETVAGLKDEVDRLVKVDLTKAEPLAAATRRIAGFLADPVSLGFGDAAVAQVHQYCGRLAEAEPLYKAAIERLRGAGRRVDAAGLERQLVGLFHRQGRAREALDVARRARRTLARSGRRDLLAQLESNVGSLYYFTLGRHRSALTHFERARAIFEELGDDSSLAVVEYNLANVLFELDRPEEAAALYAKAERLNLAEGRTLFAAQCSFALAYTLASLGRYGEALRRYYAARERLLKVGDRPLAAWAALSLAELHGLLNVVDEAAALAETAFEEFSGLDGHALEAARARVVRAQILERRRDFERAGLEMEAARETFDAHGIAVSRAKARIAQAGLALARSQDEAAERFAVDAEKIFRSARISSGVAHARLLRAEALRRLGRRGPSIRLARSVVAAATRHTSPWLASRAETLLGELELDRGRHAEGVAALERAIAGIEGLRLRLRPGEARAAFLADKLTPYERLVAVHLARGGADGLRAAFRYVEMAKSRSLADLMAQHVGSAASREGAAGEAGVRAQLARRLEELSWYSSRIESQSDKGDTRNTRLDAQLRTELARCESELASLFRRLEVEDSGLAALLAVEPAGLEEISSELAPGDAAIEFFVVGDRVSAFVITRDGATAHTDIADVRAVEAHVTGLRFQFEKFALGNRYAAAHRGALRRCADNHLEALHRALLAPLERSLDGRRLLVIPHGPLHYVPMHALKGPDGKYLVERSEVTYAPSATVHRLCARRPAPRTTGGLLAVGVSDARTPHISGELSAIGALFSDALLLEGERASKAAFLESAPRHRFLHLATHGFFRQDNPLFSSVRLVDGPLNFYDVFDLTLDAELVTLSACNTGLNKLAPGDELSGLMRGFLYAGAPSLLVSLWAVNDESTSELMRSFYGHLRAGASKSTALRLAELEALERFGHPYYWAPFVLMGKP